ncbi:MAG: alcohol dehydrogenase catalytic domain-containing protein [Candidatus Heimdallarchaeota archaeon]
MVKLLAVVQTINGPILEDRPIPSLKPDDVLIRMEYAGVCGTDLAIIRGDYKVPLPLILGHEFAGHVKEVGASITDIQPGDRVTAEINLTCGTCPFCMIGLRTHCTNVRAIGIFADGAFADYIVMPRQNVHLLPKALDTKRAVFVEPLAAVLQAFRLTHVEPSETIVILGTGRLGLLAIQIAKLTGTKVIAINRSLEKLKLAHTYGTDLCLSTIDPTWQKHLKEETKIGPKYIFESTGKGNMLNIALELIRPQGTILMKSTPGSYSEVNTTKLVVKEVTLQGSRCGPFPPAIDLLNRGLVKVDSMMQDVLPLKDGVRALEIASNKIKVLLHT